MDAAKAPGPGRRSGGAACPALSGAPLWTGSASGALEAADCGVLPLGMVAEVSVEVAGVPGVGGTGVAVVVGVVVACGVPPSVKGAPAGGVGGVEGWVVVVKVVPVLSSRNTRE